jgi:hypothetical protein
VGRVEREDARLQLGQRDAVLGAGELLAEEQLALLVDQVDADEPLCQPGRGLDRLPEPRAQVGLHHEPVDHDLDRVLELLVELDRLLEQAAAGRPPSRRVKPWLRSSSKIVAVLALAVAHDRRVDGEARPSGSASTWSTICSIDWPAIGRPQIGQCGWRPARRAGAGSRRSR